jgi:hypothetical protein
MGDNRMATLSSRIYRLEPGNGTSYRFMIIPLRDDAGIYPGIGNGVNWSLLVGFDKAVPVEHYEVRNLKPYYVRDVASRMRHSSHHDIAAVLLAMGVLIDTPDDLEGACRAMLAAPELL